MTYWEERRKRLDASMAKDEKRLFAKLATYYDREAARLDREIAAYYAKYGEQDVIAYRVLLRNLSDADRQLLLERMDVFAEKYPEYAHLLPVRTSIYKLNRLEGLRQSIAMQQLEMGAQEQKQAKAFFQRMALRYANASAEYLGFGKRFYSVDHNAIQRILGNAWCNAKDFSARIWENRQRLAQTLQTDFVNAFIRGDSYQRISRMMRQKFQNVSKSNMERLVFTEDTYLAAESSMMPFSQYYDRYLYECADGNACAICRALQGESFPIRDRMPGLNFPPMHPWCRCTFTIDLNSRNKNPLPAARKAQNQAKSQALELLTSGADGGIIKAYQLNTTSKQFGKKIGKHAADYGLDPAKEEDRKKLKHRIQEIASSPDCVIPGTWRGQGEMQADGKQQDGVVDYVIKDSDVIVAKDGNFITIIKDGIHSSGRIRKTYEEYLNEKR